MRRTLIISDVHLEQKVETDPSYLTIRNMIAKERFDQIVILGDFLDFSYISHWTEDSPGLTEGKRLKADLDLLDSEFKYMKKYTKSIIFLEGNHEERIQKLIFANPVLEGLISLDEICAKHKVEYISTQNQPYSFFNDLYFAHGLALSKYCAANNVEKSGVSIIAGHSHRTQLYTTSYLNQKPITGYSIGCISSISPDYVKGKRITGHSQSFAILSSDTDMWDMQVYMLKKHCCIIDGKLYKPFK